MIDSSAKSSALSKLQLIDSEINSWVDTKVTESFLMANDKNEKFLRSDFEIGSKSFVLNLLSLIAKGFQALFYHHLKQKVQKKHVGFIGDWESLAVTSNGKPDHAVNLYHISMKRSIPILLIEEKYNSRKSR